MHGRLVMIDDAKFDPVFDFIREQHRVLIGHQGEPHNCWLPLDQMTVNNDKEYFREHPQYHMYPASGIAVLRGSDGRARSDAREES